MDLQILHLRKSFTLIGLYFSSANQLSKTYKSQHEKASQKNPLS